MTRFELRTSVGESIYTVHCATSSALMTAQTAKEG